MPVECITKGCKNWAAWSNGECHECGMKVVGKIIKTKEREIQIKNGPLIKLTRKETDTGITIYELHNCSECNASPCKHMCVDKDGAFDADKLWEKMGKKLKYYKEEILCRRCIVSTKVKVEKGDVPEGMKVTCKNCGIEDIVKSGKSNVGLPCHNIN